jgi:hypothetical protein
MNHCNILKVTALSVAFLISAAASAQTTLAPKPPPPSPTSVTTNAEGKDFSLQLAKAELAKQGIRHPTQKQINVARSSIQARRNQGEGWGEIAHSLGLNFGKVVSAANRHPHDERQDSKHLEKGERKAAKGGVALASHHASDGAGGDASHGEHAGHSSGGGSGAGGGGGGGSSHGK